VAHEIPDQGAWVAAGTTGSKLELVDIANTEQHYPDSRFND
jgi:hypothetical protein